MKFMINGGVSSALRCANKPIERNSLKCKAAGSVRQLPQPRRWNAPSCQVDEVANRRDIGVSVVAHLRDVSSISNAFIPPESRRTEMIFSITSV